MTKETIYRIRVTDWELAVLTRALEKLHNAHNLFDNNLVIGSPLHGIKNLHRKLIATTPNKPDREHPCQGIVFNESPNALYRERPCDRNGTVELKPHWFCWQHARMETKSA